MSKYKIIVKVGNDKFVKYHSSNLLTFTYFLDKDWKEWRYFNVYGKDGNLLDSFTQAKRPLTKYVSLSLF